MAANASLNKREKAMQRTRSGFLVCSVMAALLLLASCGGGGPSQEEQQREAEWAWLTETKQELDAKRQELADLRARAAAAAEAVAAEAEPAVAAGEAELEGAELAEPVVDLAAQVQQLGEEVTQLGEELNGRLVAFINADPMIEGEPPTERQVAALRMKSSEDIVLAREWIEKGGDYKRAIEIYNTALMFDPDNEEVKAALAEAEADRYMSEERLSQVKNGMGEAEVRELLGQVNLHNVREYPEKEVVAWFYPTAEDGSAAAVWFEPDKKTGELTVYQVKFDAVKPGVSEEDTG